MKNKTIIKMEIFLKNNTPKFFWKITQKVWVGIFMKINKRIEKNKLKKFKKPIYKLIKYKNISFFILIKKKNFGIDTSIYMNNIYEEDIMDLFYKYIKKEDVVFDIGANIGYHSLFISKIVGDKGKVYSFEPIKNLTEQLEKSINKNNITNININNIAVGNSNYETDIYLNEENIGGSSLVNKSFKNKEKIIVKKLDGIYFNKIKKLNFVKIDVEGFEYEVLLGMEKLINKFKPKIILEYSPILYKNNDDLNIINFLKKIGYKLYDIDNNMKMIKNPENFCKKFNRSQTNLLCINKEN